jgi:tetratricopeptide (TPR) repeat protein
VKSRKLSLNRRRFLSSTCAVPVLGRFWQLPVAYAEEKARQAPYLKLAPYIVAGSDHFPEEVDAMHLETALEEAITKGELPVGSDVRLPAMLADQWRHPAPELSEAVFPSGHASGVQTPFRQWLQSFGQIRRARFYRLPDEMARYEISSTKDGHLLYTTGQWKVGWRDGRITSVEPQEEIRALAEQPMFSDVTGAVFADSATYREQFSKGVPYWRARLDPASGIDVYGSNGIAAGDIDGDGKDEIFVCQPGGLPNRLLRYRDGKFEDITEQWGLALLDDTSAALFLDLRNSGRQDLIVLRSSGPLLYINEGIRFRMRDDAFRFASKPQGGFTGMASCDYDRDGRLDVYLCTYVYFQTEAQFTYPVPYHDAQNGPPNFLFRNLLNQDGSGSFEDVTLSSGVNQNNNRFSFAPSWCDADGDGWPDLYVANDFGRNNFYKNTAGKFQDVAAAAGIEDLGPGMSSSWFDYDGDMRPDLYVANMWSPAGQRIIQSERFAPAKGAAFAMAYQRHTRGNSLYQNKGNGSFDDVSDQQHVRMGRWAWSSVGHDFDNDGSPEILIGCGMLSNVSRQDLMGFFWRQVVALSPQKQQPSAEYQEGWNAINQFAREQYSWNGNEPNVMYVRRGDRYYDVSGISGIDFADDTRAFAITDFDGDGRPDLVLKSRLGPQVRVLQNSCADGRSSIGFDLKGTKSNRDAIGAKIEVGGRAVWLSAESGFLSQHSKRVIVGLDDQAQAVQVKITWPSGATQELAGLEPGYVYAIEEGSQAFTRKAFEAHKALPHPPVECNNESKILDTWFMEPVPLPKSFGGPALLAICQGGSSFRPAGIRLKLVDINAVPEQEMDTWRVFRRYLFDYRQDLETPFYMLLDSAGRAVKVYAGTPSADIVQADFEQLSKPTTERGLPFPGEYHKSPHRDYFKFAAGMLWNGHTEAALPYLNETLKRDSNNARVLMLIGQIHLESNRLDDAEQYLQKALEINPAYADAWSVLGGVYLARENARQALVCFERALTTSPDTTYILLNAGQAAEKMAETVTAEKYYRHAVDTNPESADAANALGLLLAKQWRGNEAKALFERAIELRRDFGSAINNLGVLYLNLGKVDDAVEAFQYGLKAAPDEDILYLNLGRVYARQGQNERAREIMQLLLARKPGNEIAERALRELQQR